eukprot:Rhum_TRINITY_DN14918_c7_g1::Rhum_TRINITY_DN14918_c7_g1_i1::g.127981::m.127981
MSQPSGLATTPAADIPEALRPFVTGDVLYIRLMDKVSSKKRRQRRVVAITGNSVVLADPRTGNVKRFFTNESVQSMQFQDVPARGKTERHLVLKVKDEHDLALVQVDSRNNPPGAGPTDDELTRKLPEWVQATTGRPLPVESVPLDRDIISEADRKRKPGYEERRNRMLEAIHQAAKRKRAEDAGASQLSVTPLTAPAGFPDGDSPAAAPLPTPLLQPATPTTEDDDS